MVRRLGQLFRWQAKRNVRPTSARKGDKQGESELVGSHRPKQNTNMTARPKKFNLLDIETEPTDAQLAEVMDRVAESVRKKRIIGQQTLKDRMDAALAQERVAQLLKK
jgi:hypothetical protein